MENTTVQQNSSSFNLHHTKHTAYMLHWCIYSRYTPRNQMEPSNTLIYGNTISQIEDMRSSPNINSHRHIIDTMYI
jgi:hypothetical protein